MKTYSLDNLFTTNELFKLPEDSIIDSGICEDSTDGIYIKGTNLNVRWIAKTSAVNDWCIYCYYNNYTNEFIFKHGHKVKSKNEIKRCIPCTEDVLTRYRF